MRAGWLCGLWIMCCPQLQATECPLSLRMAYNASWLPYVEVTDEQVRGSDIIVIRQLLSQVGSTLQLQYVPEKRALQMLQQGGVDLLFAASYTAERASYAWFSKPYRKEYNVVLVHRRALEVYPEIRQRASFLMLAARKLVGAYNPMGFYGADFEQLKQQQAVRHRSLAVYEADRRLELVLNQRADYTIVDKAAVALELQHHAKASDLLVLPFHLNEADIHLMLAKTTVSAACVDAINRQLGKP